MDKVFCMNDVIGSGLKANLHFINPCNAHCRGCFATSFAGDTRLMSLDKIKTVILNLGSCGVNFFNIAGGEPTLHPALHETLKFICECGFKASIITNGFKLSDELIAANAPYLDTIGVSIDSFDEATSLALGRYTGSPAHPRFFGYNELASLNDMLKGSAVKLKVNTVVSRLNCSEVMADRMNNLDICRWKIIKLSAYQDSIHSNLDMVPSDEEYQKFIEANPFHAMVIEKNMTNTYLVVDPDGNLLDNSAAASNPDSPYRSVGNLLYENASEVLRRFLSIFNLNAYRQRYSAA